MKCEYFLVLGAEFLMAIGMTAHIGSDARLDCFSAGLLLQLLNSRAVGAWRWRI